MKIDYPLIDWADVRPGDTVLSREDRNTYNQYIEFVVPQVKVGTPAPGTRYYLIERPEPEFPTKPGRVIIAKRVRDVVFSDGVVLTKTDTRRVWVSHDMKIDGSSAHDETMIKDWVIAKVLPA